jgi:hypothetical protein
VWVKMKIELRNFSNNPSGAHNPDMPFGIPALVFDWLQIVCSTGSLCFIH